MMRDLAQDLALRWFVQSLAVAAVVTHHGNLMIVLLLAVAAGAGLVWAAAVEAVHPCSLT